MNCLNCGELLVETETDSRQEWSRTYYERCKCGKMYERLTSYQAQSSLIEKDELEEVKDG